MDCGRVWWDVLHSRTETRWWIWLSQNIWLRPGPGHFELNTVRAISKSFGHGPVAGLWKREGVALLSDFIKSSQILADVSPVLPSHGEYSPRPLHEWLWMFKTCYTFWDGIQTVPSPVFRYLYCKITTFRFTLAFIYSLFQQRHQDTELLPCTFLEDDNESTQCAIAYNYLYGNSVQGLIYKGENTGSNLGKYCKHGIFFPQRGEIPTNAKLEIDVSE